MAGAAVKQKVLDAYEVCGSIREAARMAQCDYRTALHHIKKAGVHVPRQKREHRVGPDGALYYKTEKGYWRANKPHRKYLHITVWETANGPVEDEHHVHHKDLDKDNNALENLILLDNVSHQKYHMERRRS